MNAYHVEILDYKVMSETPFPEKREKEGYGGWKSLLLKEDYFYLVADDNVLALIDMYGVPLWETVCPAYPDKVLKSKDTYLIMTRTPNYHYWGFLGPALFIDARNGQIIKEVKGEVSRLLKDGNFLLGLEGYGIFKTGKYNGNGELLYEWSHYGHYLEEDNGDVIVVDQDRMTPTKGKVVRLRQDGIIEEGEKLLSCRASSPIKLNKGDFAYIDEHYLVICNAQLKLIQKVRLMEDTVKMQLPKLIFENGIYKVSIMENGGRDDTKWHVWSLSID